MSRSATKPRYLLYGLSALLLVIFLFTAFGERGLLHLWHLQEEKRDLDEKNFVLQRENEKLRENIDRLRKDDLYLERLAREELGLVREGEIIYQFPSEVVPPSSQSSEQKALP